MATPAPAPTPPVAPKPIPLFVNVPLTDEQLPAFFSRAAMKSHRLHWKDKVPATSHNSPGFKPTRGQAVQVEKMRALGLNTREISLVLQIEKSLLEFYYSYELKTAKLRTNVAVAKVALTMALSGADSDMTRFWLKTQAGWKEKDVVEHEGLDAVADEAKAARAKLLEDAP